MLHNGKNKKDRSAVDAEFTCIGNPHNVTAEMVGCNPHNVTVEALLTPRARETELISLPRAEYERLIRTEEDFTRICNLLKDDSLSPYTIGEVVKALFPEQAPVKTKPEAGTEQTESEGADA